MGVGGGGGGGGGGGEWLSECICVMHYLVAGYCAVYVDLKPSSKM